MFWHLLLSEQREQLGRQLLCCLGRQPIAVFAKARDRRQRRGKSRRQHKRTEYRGADHCCTPDLEPFLSECLSWVALSMLWWAIERGRMSIIRPSRVSALPSEADVQCISRCLPRANSGHDNRYCDATFSMSGNFHVLSKKGLSGP